MCQGGSSSERPLTSAEVLDSFLEHKCLTVRFLGHFPLELCAPHRLGPKGLVHDGEGPLPGWWQGCRHSFLLAWPLLSAPPQVRVLHLLSSGIQLPAAAGRARTPSSFPALADSCPLSAAPFLLLHW